MGEDFQMLVFNVESQYFAIPLKSVQRVILSVRVYPLADVPPFISGVVNFHGTFLPVVNLRMLFGFPEQIDSFDKQMIIVKTKSISLVLEVDGVTNVIETTREDVFGAEEFKIEDKSIKGILKLKENVVLLYDLDKILNTEQMLYLQKAIIQETL